MLDSAEFEMLFIEEWPERVQGSGGNLGEVLIQPNPVENEEGEGSDLGIYVPDWQAPINPEHGIDQ
jgi:hypothetical protein